jgi:hypothetical protein
MTWINYATLISRDTWINYATLISRETWINYATQIGRETWINYATLIGRETWINYATLISRETWIDATQIGRETWNNQATQICTRHGSTMPHGLARRLIHYGHTDRPDVMDPPYYKSARTHGSKARCYKVVSLLSVSFK